MLTGKELGAAIRAAIEKKGVSKAEVARVFEIKPPSVQDWMNKGTIGKDKLPALWHYFSDVVGPDHWGLDAFPRWPTRPRTAHAVREPDPEYAGRARSARPIPVVGSAKLGEDGFYEEVSSAVGHGDGHIEIETADPNAYGLRVRGQSMFPAIRDGWYVLVEPNMECHAGGYVLIRLRDGRKMVKELLFVRGGNIEVMSVNGGDRLSFDASDLEEERGMQAVGAVLPPWKWRPD